MATDRVSSYLTHLPALLQEDPFVGRFLLAFERILSGLHPPDPKEPPDLQDIIDKICAHFASDLQRSPAEQAPINLPRWLASSVALSLRSGQPPGLEEVIDKIDRYFVPGPDRPDTERTPFSFLSWLASWVALSLREDWREEEQRRFMSGIVSQYKYRGTKKGLEQMLHTYTRESVVIYEFEQPPHYFQVEMTLSQPTPERRKAMAKVARAIIDQEKPAHTFYTLHILFPSMQIRNDGDDPQYRPNTRGVWIGRTTTLGTTSETGDR